MAKKEWTKSDHYKAALVFFIIAFLFLLMWVFWSLNPASRDPNYHSDASWFLPFSVLFFGGFGAYNISKARKLGSGDPLNIRRHLKDEDS